MIEESLGNYSPNFTYNENEHNTSQSRRQLFPSIENDDIDDFTYITPLNTAVLSPCSSLTQTDFELHLSNAGEDYIVFNQNSIQDYAFVENIYDATKNSNENNSQETFSDAIKTPQSEKHIDRINEITMSPLFLSPAQIVPQSVAFSPKKQKQKFPDICDSQEFSGLNTIANKLIRNYSVDDSPTDFTESNKYKFSSFAKNKQTKLDQVSKARTELFPKDSIKLVSNNSNLKPQTVDKMKSKPPQVFLCGRKMKRSFGQINAGVGHKIRRPKIKKKKIQIRKPAVKTPTENFAVTEYLKSIDNISSDFSKKQIQPLMYDLLATEQAKNNTENIPPKTKRQASSPIPDIPKKFFKSHRNAAVVMDEHLNFTVNRDTVNSDKINLDEFDINLDVSDLIVPDKEDLISSKTIDKIVDSLESVNNSTKNEPTAHNSPIIEDCIHLYSYPDNCSNALEKEEFNKFSSLEMNSEVCKNTGCLLQNCKHSVSNDNNQQLVLTAHNSVTRSENSIHLHVSSDNCRDKVQKKVIDKSILLSPTSQMCNMTSGLALDSPRKNQSHLTNSLNEMVVLDNVNEEISATDEKLYPIFCGKQNTSNNYKAPKVSVTKKLKPLPKNQLLLDLGQKKFGATQCTACKFVYHMGDPNDELMHLNYHNAGTILRFGGWKDERVVSQLNNARIIKVIPGDPKPWLKKVKDLLEVINRDLGYYEMPVSVTDTQIFLYIKKHIIAGCLVAEPRSTAYKLLSENVGIDLCSELSYPIKCGVNRIWVSQAYRKEGIGTSLMNCLRGNFMYGYILTKDDIAFSSPTDQGKAFAAKYFSTCNFLVYT